MYEEVLENAKALMHDEADLIANMANISALIKETFGFWWVGLPGAAKTARIVAGTLPGLRLVHAFPLGRCLRLVVEKEMTLIVPDVSQFPGHIACSPIRGQK